MLLLRADRDDPPSICHRYGALTQSRNCHRHGRPDRRFHWNAVSREFADDPPVWRVGAKRSRCNASSDQLRLAQLTEQSERSLLRTLFLTNYVR
jgi:hypothetical protein